MAMMGSGTLLLNTKQGHGSVAFAVTRARSLAGLRSTESVSTMQAICLQIVSGNSHRSGILSDKCPGYHFSENIMRMFGSAD